jgi:outer membrane protein TolC
MFLPKANSLQNALIGFIILTGNLVFAQEQSLLTITFDEAYEQMHENSHVLKQSEYLIREKEAERKATTGLRMPRISISANAIKMSERLELDLTPVRDAINPLYSALGNYGVFSGVPNPDPATSSMMPFLPDNISTQAVRGQLLEGQKTMNDGEWVKTLQEDRFAAVNANVIWPLFTGGKINAAIKASEIEKDEAELNSQLKRNELLSELVERYYGLCLAQQAVNVREQVLEAMEKHLFDSQKLSEQGQIARVQYLHAQVAVADADRELKKAKREMEIVERALHNTIVSDNSLTIKTLSPLFFMKEIEDETWFVQLAKNNNIYLKLFDSKKELAGVGVQFEKSKYLPDVAFSGTYDIANKDLSPYLPKWTIGLGMKWTLFEGNARSQKLQSARYKQDQVEEAGLKIEDDILTGIRKYHQELAMQAEQIESLKKTLEFANAYCESQEKAFSEGISSSSDLVDANLLVAKTKIDRLQAMYKYDKSLASLLQLCGQPQLFNRYISSEHTINESL